jgi:hypothetical protein
MGIFMAHSGSQEFLATQQQTVKQHASETVSSWLKENYDTDDLLLICIQQTPIIP